MMKIKYPRRRATLRATANLIRLALAIVILVGGWQVLKKLDAVQTQTADVRRKLNRISADLDVIRVHLNDSNAAERVSYMGASYDVYVADVGKSKIDFYWKDGLGRAFGSIGALKEHLERQGRTLLFATNAGMYTPEQIPVGLYVENQRQLVRLNLDRGRPGNFFLQPNGVFIVSEGTARIVESSAYLGLDATGVRSATQSGPLLVHNGAVNPAFQPGSTNLRLRSGVGIVSADRVVFAISNEPVSFYEFAMLFKEAFGCKDALFLDGEISLMYSPKLSRFDTGGAFGGIIAVTK